MDGFGHPGPHLGGGPPSFAPFIGAIMFLFFLLVVASTLFLLRRGIIGPPPWVASHRSPENEAKKVLAERFARGDISSDDFLERASVLNWTPGSDTWETRKRRRHS
jgi:putative membrane protein